MTANSIVTKLLEAEHSSNPDESSAFLTRYMNVFERNGFKKVISDDGSQEWRWKDGPFEIEVEALTVAQNNSQTILNAAAAQLEPSKNVYW